MSVLKSTPARLVTLALVVQAALLYSSIRKEYVPESQPLARFPARLGDWSVAQEGVVDKETQAVLKADDLLSRVYARAGASPANLFVAFFRTQRTGKAPHSPKNCLPGSGWLPVLSDRVSVDSGAGPIEVNRYVVTHGEARSLVLYWYQSRDRVVASEYSAKFYVVADAIRLNRTDTALVRVTVPMAGKEDTEQAMDAAADFIKAFFATLRQYLPA